MQNVLQWFAMPVNALALVVTLGVAIFLFCCLECSECPSRDKDEIFRRHAL